MTIIGHTDSDRVVKPTTIAHLKGLGKPADNMGLSDARAEAVAAVLGNGGIDARRMSTEGKGQSLPIADNRTPEGKAQNRRVEIYLAPLPRPKAP
jgi:outer membrane protein OmpA-like peptidoglycan-associated protein